MHATNINFYHTRRGNGRTNRRRTAADDNSFVSIFFARCSLLQPQPSVGGWLHGSLTDVLSSVVLKVH